jgi:hypothetical protein
MTNSEYWKIRENSTAAYVMEDSRNGLSLYSEPIDPETLGDDEILRGCVYGVSVAQEPRRKDHQLSIGDVVMVNAPRGAYALHVLLTDDVEIED